MKQFEQIRLDDNRFNLNQCLVPPLKGPHKQYAAAIYQHRFGPPENLDFNIDIRAVNMAYTVVPDMEYHTCDKRCGSTCPMHDPVKVIEKGGKTNWPECSRCSRHDGWIVFANTCGTRLGKPVFYSIDFKHPLCGDCFNKYHNEGNTWPPGENHDEERTRRALLFRREGDPYEDIVKSWKEPDYSPDEEVFEPNPRSRAMEKAWFGHEDEIPEDDDCGYCGGGFYSSNGERGGCKECVNHIREEYREQYPRGLLDELEEATIDWLPSELRGHPQYRYRSWKTTQVKRLA